MSASPYYPTRDVKRDDERDGLLDSVRFLAEHNKRAEERSAALRAKLAEVEAEAARLRAETPEWIVNDNGELGVMVHGRAFFLYKGDSLEYDKALHDDGTPMMYRAVGKREFGECCHPVALKTIPFRYTEPLVNVLGPQPENGGWKPLPVSKESDYA